MMDSCLKSVFDKNLKSILLAACLLSPISFSYLGWVWGDFGSLFSFFVPRKIFFIIQQSFFRFSLGPTRVSRLSLRTTTRALLQDHLICNSIQYQALPYYTYTRPCNTSICQALPASARRHFNTFPPYNHTMPFHFPIPIELRRCKLQHFPHL